MRCFAAWFRLPRYEGRTALEARTVAYEIWDTETNNLIGAYETLDTALAVVRRALEAHGVDYVATLALGFEDSRGHSRTVAEGHQLVDRARALAAMAPASGSTAP